MVKKIAMFVLFASALAGAKAQTASEPEKLPRREKYDRGLAFDTKTPSMPKGLWVAGINVSYAQHENDNYRFLIIDRMNSESNSLNLSPMVHYVFANNQSIGVRFAYKRNLVDIQNLDLLLTDELNSMLFGDNGVRYKFRNHTYMGYLSYRYYVGMGSTSKRLLFFNEVQAGFGGGQQREDTGWNNDKTGYKTGTFQNTFHFRLGLAPGATFFVTNVLAIEVQLGLLGYEFKKVTQFGTNLPTASRTTSSISTRFDFLSIAFGTTFYL